MLVHAFRKGVLEAGCGGFLEDLPQAGHVLGRALAVVVGAELLRHRLGLGEGHGGRGRLAVNLKVSKNNNKNNNN